MNPAAVIPRGNRWLGHLALGDIALVEKRRENAGREYALAADARPNDPEPLYRSVPPP